MTNCKKCDGCNKCNKCKLVVQQHGCKNNKKHCECNNRENCKHREYRDHSYKLRCKLGKLQYKKCCCIPKANAEEIKYKNYNYNGSFTKGLAHDSTYGRLVDPSVYETMRYAIRKNDQTALASVPLAVNALGKLVNPLASWTTVLIGAPQCTIKLIDIPTLSSDALAAEMVELYCQELARDIQFRDYSTSPTITTILNNTHINKPDVLASLQNYTPVNIPFTAQTVFRGISSSEKFGPYISQLLYLNVPMGAITLTQKYNSPKPVLVAPGPAGSRVEWGVNRAEQIFIQNTQLASLPAATSPGDILQTYIYSGRSLAEAVHIDPAYQFGYHAALILSALGASPNPGWPIYPNQASFITGVGGPSIQCAVAEITGLSLKAAWFHKWQKTRNLRPEAFGLAVDVVVNTPSENAGNYDISNVILNNGVLTDIAAYHAAAPYSSPNSYTLSSAYREGSPLHPSSPSGHACIGASTVTLLKMFFDCEKLWGSLPGVISNSLSGGVLHPVEAGVNGSTLTQYLGLDVGSMTISGELNKLAANIGIGRNWSSVHYRSDYASSMYLGEQVAIHYMEDLLSSMVENNLTSPHVPKITFRKFNGNLCTVKAKICQKQC